MKFRVGDKVQIKSGIGTSFDGCVGEIVQRTGWNFEWIVEFPNSRGGRNRMCFNSPELILVSKKFPSFKTWDMEVVCDSKLETK